jgi:holin-like protein
MVKDVCLWRMLIYQPSRQRAYNGGANLLEFLMLLRGLTWLVLFQLVGTALNHLFLPILPGPIIGLVLLLIFLMTRGEVSEPLSLAASSLLRYLPLLLVPPAVGVMVYAAEIAADFWAIVGSLVLSLLLSLAFVGWLMQKLVLRQSRRGESS